jgi:hypothetical protein
MPAIAIPIMQAVISGIAMTPTIISGVQTIIKLMQSNQPPTLADWQSMDAALMEANNQLQAQVEGQQPATQTTTPAAS